MMQILVLSSNLQSHAELFVDRLILLCVDLEKENCLVFLYLGMTHCCDSIANYMTLDRWGVILVHAEQMLCG